MKKVKITVLKTTLDKELADEYGAEGLTACPMMKEGHIPVRICFSPWLRKGTFLLRRLDIKANVAIVSCNDGLRPVIMKLEATDEESKIDYTPVR